MAQIVGGLRVRVALVLVYMLFAILLNSVGTVILQSIASFQVTKVEASLLEAFKDLSIAVASLFLGALVPQFGYRRSMIAALVVVALATMMQVTLHSFRATEILFAAVGIAFAATKISVYSSIALLTRTPAQHASLTNTIEGMFMAGMLGGYWLFSAFIDRDNPGNLHWLDVYWVMTALCVLAILLLLVSPLDESPAKAAAERTTIHGFSIMYRLVGRRLVCVFLVSAALYVLIEQGIGTWLPTFNREVLNLPNAMSVQAASMFAAGLALGRLSAGIALRRIGWFALLMVCLAAMMVLLLLTLPLARDLVPDPRASWLHAPSAAYLIPLIGLFMAPIYPVINSTVLSGLPKDVHAPMTGLIIVFSALGGTAGSRLMAMVFAHLGGQRAFYSALVPMLALVAALVLFKREIDRQDH